MYRRFFIYTIHLYNDLIDSHNALWTVVYDQWSFNDIIYINNISIKLCTRCVDKRINGGEMRGARAAAFSLGWFYSFPFLSTYLNCRDDTDWQVYICWDKTVCLAYIFNILVYYNNFLHCGVLLLNKSRTPQTAVNKLISTFKTCFLPKSINTKYK